MKTAEVGASISERLVTVSRDVDPNAALIPALCSMSVEEHELFGGDL
ncbi:MAG TPA: hypothetical protein PKH75_10015 [Bacillota bacterium]|jgi:hypothetical protein|nr:hypothetical protein [Bacillota bacterium]